VRRERSDVQGIKKFHGIHPFVGEHFSLSPDTYHHMFVPVFLEAAVAAWKYLKIPEVKFCGFTGIANDNLPHNISPVTSFWLIPFCFYSLPREIALVCIKSAFPPRFFPWHVILLIEMSYENTTILFKESLAREVRVKASAVFSMGNVWVTNRSALTHPSRISARAFLVSAGPHE